MTHTRRGFFARVLGVLCAPLVAKVAKSDPFDKIEPVHRPLYDGENPWAGLVPVKPPRTATEIMRRREEVFAQMAADWKDSERKRQEIEEALLPKGIIRSDAEVAAIRAARADA